MAVEATHQIPNQHVPFSWHPQQDFNIQNSNVVHQLIPSAAAAAKQSFYQPDSIPAKTIESGLTYNVLPTNPRKRSLESMNSMHQQQLYVPTTIQKIHNNGVDSSPSPFSLLPGDELLLPQFQQHQFEIDNILSQHSKKMRFEIEQIQRHQSKLVATAVAEKAIKKLREKDEQIHKMGKLNMALQERVRSLFMENQLWRDLAQTNEAQAQSLRFDLEQVMAANQPAAAAAEEEDAQSCCGSSGDVAGGEDQEMNKRMCKMCGERESCVLLLPCRHLCLCGVCGSGPHHVHACPVCNSTMTATLHVNLSP